MTIDILDGGPTPKRGDIIQTNVGNRRERTWMVLRVRKTLRRHRYKVWMVRWWELEADFRMRLYRSALRAGGQGILYVERYPAKKKKRPFNVFPLDKG